MIRRIIEISATHRILVLVIVVALCAYAAHTLQQIRLDALPDLSDTQVIIFSQWDRSPDILEDQVTYPIIAALLGAPNVKAIRGFSDFGFSYVYVVFQDGTDIYWARSRVLEYLSQIQTRLPEGVRTELGPDAITDEFEPESAIANLGRYVDAEIGVALLNQRLLAGVGNVFKSEVLFIRRIWPWTKVRDLTYDELAGLIAESNTLLKLNRMRPARRTHFSLNDTELLWVYGRSGRPCRACGCLVKVRRQGLDGRVTFFCPDCQMPHAQGRA